MGFPTLNWLGHAGLEKTDKVVQGFLTIRRKILLKIAWEEGRIEIHLIV